MPEDDVIRVTGLSDVTPAAPPDEGVAQPEEHPAASEEVETITAQAPAAPSEQEEETETEQVEAAPRKPARGVQKALDRLTARAEEAERRERQSTEALQAALAKLTPQVTREQPKQDGPPKQEDFSDWQSFNAATVKYMAKQEVIETLKTVARANQEAQAQAVNQQRAQQLANKVVKSMENVHTRFKDWDEKVTASNAPMPNSLAHAIAISEDPPAVMYALGSNPQIHARLLQMSPEEQSYYVGRIVSVPSQNAVASRAPAPARPVGGARASIGSLEYNDNFTPAQHKAWLARQ